MSLGMPEQKKKSFWERPEGTTGMLALAAGGGALWFAAPAILAFVTTLTAIVGQTIMLVILGVILFALFSLITNKKVRTLVSYMFKSAMRKVTGVFVEIDPIGIMKSYVEELQNKRETMGVSRDKLMGQIRVLERKINATNDKFETAMSIAAKASKEGNTGTFRVHANQAGRMEKLNKTSYVPMLTQLQVHLRALNKFYDVTGTVISDLANEVEAREEERKVILDSHSAMMAAKQILNGGTDSRELFDQAMEYVVEDYGMKMGEIDSFLESSKSFVDGLDMQNGVYEDAALKRIQEWEAKGDSILLGNSKAQLLEHTTLNSTLFTQIGAPSPVTIQQDDYERLLRK